MMAVDTGTLDQVTQQFLTAFQNNAGLIAQVAKGLFFKLALIQLTITFLWMSLAGESLQRLLIRFVQISAVFGCFYACIEYGSIWIPDVINGFIELGQRSGVMSIDPSSIVNQGFSIAGAILHAFFGWGLLGHPFVSFVGAVVCISIVIIYALLAAELAVVLVKSYFLVSISSLFFAFGATELTRPMTVNYFKTVIGIGLQLLTLYFLIGVGQYVGQNWASMTVQAAQNHELMPMLVILAGVIVYYMIVKNVPTFVAGLSGVGGFRNYGAAAVGMAIQAGMTGASHLTTAKKMAGSLIQSGGQTFQAIGKSWQGGSSNFWQTAKQATGHLAKSTMQSAGDSVMQKNQHMSFGQRVNSHIANRVKSKGS